MGDERPVESAHLAAQWIEQSEKIAVHTSPGVNKWIDYTLTDAQSRMEIAALIRRDVSAVNVLPPDILFGTANPTTVSIHIDSTPGHTVRSLWLAGGTLIIRDPQGDKLFIRLRTDEFDRRLRKKDFDPCP